MKAVLREAGLSLGIQSETPGRGHPKCRSSSLLLPCKSLVELTCVLACPWAGGGKIDHCGHNILPPNEVHGYESRDPDSLERRSSCTSRCRATLNNTRDPYVTLCSGSCYSLALANSLGFAERRRDPGVSDVRAS